MTRKELRNSIRTRLDDLVGAASEKLWPDIELNDYLEEAVEEMAVECLLINDSLTASICTVTMVASQQHYALSDKIIKIEEARASWSTLPLIDARSFKGMPFNWLTAKGQPTGFCLDFSSGKLSLDKSFETVTTEAISLTVKRLPLVAMTDTTSPEFDEQYHRKLIPFVLWKAFSKPDAESQNESYSKKFSLEWEDSISSVKTREARLRPRIMVARSAETF